MMRLHRVLTGLTCIALMLSWLMKDMVHIVYFGFVLVAMILLREEDTK